MCSSSVSIHLVVEGTQCNDFERLPVCKKEYFSGSWTLGDASVKVVSGRKTTVPYFTKSNETGVCQWTQSLLRGIVTKGQEENFLFIYLACP